MNTDVKVALSAAAIVIAIAALFGFLISYPIMLLWNGCLVPAVDGVHEVGWLQAWGITILSGLLFKNVTHNTSKK